MTEEEENRLLKVIAGALKSAITDHGPITTEWTGSAAKRVRARLLEGYSDQRMVEESLRLGESKYGEENRSLRNRNARLHKKVGELSGKILNFRLGETMRLNEELPRCNCAMSPEQFRAVVEEKFNEMFPDWTDDALLCKPREALKFDDAVRLAVGADVPDEVINRTLINLRKSSVSRHQRAKE